MKNTLLAFAAGIASAAILSGHVFAQGPASSTATIIPSTTPLNVAAASKFELRALKDFKIRFANTSSESWFTVDHRLVVTFVEEGYKGRALYDNKGVWKYSIEYFDEKKLPHEIRDVVKRTYYDFNITLVQVIQIPDHMIYMVHLEDATRLKTVRVSPEGEMEVYEELDKR
ncbi:MAG TPA: hypothetical protein VGM31_11325 [Puia sp.]|jgi:hypothetical protein